MGAGNEILELLRQQGETLKRIEARTDAVAKACLAAASSKCPKCGDAVGLRVGTNSGKVIADDHDLDSEYGNPRVRKMPRRWGGENYVGCQFSEVPSDALEAIAADLDGLAEWILGKGEPDAEKNAGYKRRDAARARGWAKRNLGQPPREIVYDEPPADLPF
jgi:hypothetical protein